MLAQGGKPTPSSVAYSNWASHVQDAIAAIVSALKLTGVIGTYVGHSPSITHAADFMVPLNSPQGTAIADYVFANQQALGVDYEIWLQRIRQMNPAGNWVGMEDRGSLTQNHYDHVHVSWPLGGSIASGVAAAAGTIIGAEAGAAILPMLPAWYTKYGSPEGVKKALMDSVVGPKTTHITTPFGSGKVARILGAQADKSAETAYLGIEDEVKTLFANAAAASATAVASAVTGTLPASGQSGPIKDIVKGVVASRGWNVGAQWTALERLVQKESSWIPTAQNPTSTAYGLFQFLNSTWASTGIAKTSDPALQAEAGARYIQARYVDPIRALAFHDANNWYSEGGEVKENNGGTKQTNGKADAPTLFDTGGWLPPGITTVLNATNKPEPVLTAQMWDELVGARSAPTAAGPVIGTINQNLYDGPSPGEIAGAIDHVATVARRGGKY
jgi:hypothetical protein